ncbi:AIR synthase-related protein [Sinorhizobium sp. NFACC03]|uniref:AIR synthase-related protein n=1 Tax=Sinorhizobium sp. NFACC03 TaxID=1566295 RepID=UPI000886785D|nr:AIR synthase-related protein [Sinorhizobium sp. NFACC03]SDA94009.1 AIR synthase related protein, C-terminal domain [Sinorhizobium sp. NFACC03]
MSLRCVIIFSAALKKGALDEAGYARMIESTTRLNTPGPDLARLADVHAMADVTGFGLAGHALEMARGSGCQLRIDWSAVPLLEGFITGAAGRNWASYRQEVVFSREMGTIDKALLYDPQTSGGLLVACSRSSAPEVLDVFRKHGFEAAVIGEAVTGTAELVVA